MKIGKSFIKYFLIIIFKKKDLIQIQPIIENCPAATDIINSKSFKMEDLEDARVRHQRLEVRTVIVRPLQANDMRIALSVRQLHHTERVTERVETHRLRVDGDGTREGHVRRKIALVVMNSHGSLAFGRSNGGKCRERQPGQFRGQMA